jgi:hypothetical protein
MSMETKFTPGPWSWSEPSGAGIEVRGPYKGETRLLFSDIWRQFPEPAWDEEMRANARLIAAAPSMFEALIDCRRALELANAKGELAVVDAAIARALGKNSD